MDNMNNNTGVDTQVEETVETVDTAEKTYTQEEVLKLIQSETDKRVTAALKTQQKKFDKQMSLSKLDDEERTKAEKDNRIAELEEMVANFNIEKNRSELKSTLGARGLDVRFADIISITDDIEESQRNIDLLDKMFKAAVKAEVEKRLAATGGAPKGTATSTSSGEITKEQFKAMTLSQQAALARDNKELYEKLVKN
jgi:hypothetical protein